MLYNFGMHAYLIALCPCVGTYANITAFSLYFDILLEYVIYLGISAYYSAVSHEVGTLANINADMPP